MYRPYRAEAILGLESPHRRGDVPSWYTPIEIFPGISPQAWGCTVMWVIGAKVMWNLPTGVGMYRGLYRRKGLNRKSPHRRGDVPNYRMGFSRFHRISPQAWGCTALGKALVAGYKNLPTGVGMYRVTAVCPAGFAKSPHRRGDVPALMQQRHGHIGISPQAWGCTGIDAAASWSYWNLPTGVGMYRR